MSTDWSEIYENGECPDCGDPIGMDVVSGDACENCGHVFHIPEKLRAYVVDSDLESAHLIGYPLVKEGSNVAEDISRYRTGKREFIILNEANISIDAALNAFLKYESVNIRNLYEELMQRIAIYEQVKSRLHPHPIDVEEIASFGWAMPIGLSDNWEEDEEWLRKKLFELLSTLPC